MYFFYYYFIMIFLNTKCRPTVCLVTKICVAMRTGTLWQRVTDIAVYVLEHGFQDDLQAPLQENM